MSGFAELLPGTHPKTDATVDVSSLDRFPWPKREVYIFGKSGPPILALHELPGFTPQFAGFCTALAGEGFIVYAPLLFGRVGQTATWRNLLHVLRGRDWYLLKNATPPVIGELRRLADAIHAKRPGNMGCIGMCFTGQLPVAMLGRDFIKAAVLSQPSMPFRGDADLALDHADIDAAKQSAVPFIAFRFVTDTICKQVRADRFKAAFGSQIDFQTLPADEQKHAVLTKELFDAQGKMKASGPSRQAYDKVVAYLRRQLSGH